MIKYNITEKTTIPSIYLDEDGKVKELRSGYVIDTDKITYFQIGHTYYGKHKEQITAFRVKNVAILFRWDDERQTNMMDVYYTIQFANEENEEGEKVLRSNDNFFSGLFFNDVESVRSYIRWNCQSGLFRNRLTFSQCINNTIGGINRILATKKNYSFTYIYALNLYYMDKDMQPKEYADTRFTMLWIDEKGVHYAAEDTTRKDNGGKYHGEKLYTSCEECKRAFSTICNFDTGEEEVKDVEMVEGEIYYLTTKNDEIYLFLKSSDTEHKTGYVCYCDNPDLYEDDEENYLGIATNPTRYLIEDDDIDFISVADDEMKQKFIELVKKNIEKIQEDANSSIKTTNEKLSLIDTLMKLL